jgi:diacylglycerol kinase
MRFFEVLAISFRCAARGVGLASRQRNLRIMLGVAVLVLALATIYDVSGTSWAILLICIGFVLGAEVINTSIEKLADRVEASPDDDIRDVKDTAAAAVLLVSILAAVTGIIVLWPYATR